MFGSTRKYLWEGQEFVAIARIGDREEASSIVERETRGDQGSHGPSYAVWPRSGAASSGSQVYEDVQQPEQ